MKSLSFSIVASALLSLSVHGFAPSARSVRPTLVSHGFFVHSPMHKSAQLSMSDAPFQENEARPNEPFQYFTQQGTKWDPNTIINNGILLAIVAIVVTKMALIDHDMSRGWTATEMIHRVPLDIWGSYSSLLEDAPVTTKAVTSGTVYTIGDIIAQRTEGKSTGELDRMRVLRSLLAGFIGHGPLSHIWYNFSEGLFDGVLHWTAWWAFIPKVILDQSFWGPIWNNTYIVLLGLMKRDSVDDIVGDIKRTTIPLVISGLKLWPLAHCITYGLVPVEHRLLWVDAVEILWVTILATQAAGGDTSPVPVVSTIEEIEPLAH